MEKRLELYEPVLTDDEQQKAIRNRWFETYSLKALDMAMGIDNIVVETPEFTSGMTTLSRVFQLGREFSVPQGVIVMGPTGTGKTTLVETFRDTLPKSALFEKGLGVLHATLPKRTAQGALISSLLQAGRYPFSTVTKHEIGPKKQMLFELIRTKGTRMIVLEGAEHLFDQKSLAGNDSPDGTDVTKLICETIDVTRVAFVLTGSNRLNDLHKLDLSLASRIVRKEVFSNFKQDANWYGFLKAFEQQYVGIKLDLLAENWAPPQFYKATGGNLRSFKMLMIEAVLVAVDAGQKTLTPGIVKAAFDRIHGGGRQRGNPFLGTQSKPGIGSATS